MTRPITERFVVRTLNRVARIAYHLRPNERFAESLVKAGLKSKRFRDLGAYLGNVIPGKPALKKHHGRN